MPYGEDAPILAGEVNSKLPKNFEIEYHDGTIKQLLTEETYATSVSSQEGSWCLLKETSKKGGRTGKGKGKQVSAASLSPGTRARLRAELREIDGQDPRSQ